MRSPGRPSSIWWRHPETRSRIGSGSSLRCWKREGSRCDFFCASDARSRNSALSADGGAAASSPGSSAAAAAGGSNIEIGRTMYARRSSAENWSESQHERTRAASAAGRGGGTAHSTRARGCCGSSPTSAPRGGARAPWRTWSLTCGSATWPTSHTLVADHTTTLSQYRCSGALGSDSRTAFATTEKNFDVNFRLSGRRRGGGGARASARISSSRRRAAARRSRRRWRWSSQDGRRRARWRGRPRSAS